MLRPCTLDQHPAVDVTPMTVAKEADLASPGIGDYADLEKVLPNDHVPLLSSKETMRALYAAKRLIEDRLCEELNLTMVQVPLIVGAASGVNDYLDRDGSRTVRAIWRVIKEAESFLRECWPALADPRYPTFPDELTFIHAESSQLFVEDDRGCTPAISCLGTPPPIPIAQLAGSVILLTDG
jgi:asparagine synthetase A